MDNAFSFVKLDVKDNIHQAREVRLEASEFPVLTEDLVRLGADATAFARKIWDQCVKIT